MREEDSRVSVKEHMEERDACGLVAIAGKDGRPDTRVLAEVVDGLRALAHRSGCVDGEGDAPEWLCG